MPTGLRMRGRFTERVAITVLILLVLLFTVVTRHKLLGLDGYAERYARSLHTGRSRHVELADEVTWSDFAYCTYATAPVGWRHRLRIGCYQDTH